MKFFRKVQKQRARIFAGCIIFIFVAILLWMYITPSNIITLEGDGIKTTINITINPTNRYDPYDNTYFDGCIIPFSSDSPMHTIYYEDFEDSASDFSVTQGSMTYTTSISYEGLRSLDYTPVRRQDNLLYYSADSFNISSINTTDNILYFRGSKAMTNGYLYFYVKVVWNQTQSLKLTYLMFNSSTYTPASNEVIAGLIPYQSQTWMGILVNNTRSVLTQYNSSLELLEYNITEFGIGIQETSSFSLNIDAVKIDEYNYTTESSWYMNGEPVTDWQLNIDYTVKINSHLIESEDEIQLRIMVYSNINSSIIPNGFITLSETVILNNLIFEDFQNSHYNRISTGQYLGIFHNLPDPELIGTIIDYSFHGSFEGYGILNNGNGFMINSTKRLSDNDFTLEYY